MGGGSEIREASKKKFLVEKEELNRGKDLFSTKGVARIAIARAKF